MSKATFRRRTTWQGCIPSWDRTGLWPQRYWLWWSWDHIPDGPAREFGKTLDQLCAPKGDRLSVARGFLLAAVLSLPVWVAMLAWWWLA